MVSWLAAALLAFTIFFYVVVYTMWLKRWTPQNIVIGGAAGAFPPVIGWAAVTGTVSIEPLLLFLIVFFWTPPHFWALALHPRRRLCARRRADAAGGRGRCGDAAADLALFAAAGSGRRRALAPRLCRARLWRDVAGRRRADGRVRLAGAGRRPKARRAPSAARQMFAYSILYLFVLFAVLLIESVAGAGRMKRPDEDAMDDKPERVELTEEQKRSRRSRSIALAVILGVLVVLFYVITLVKGPAVLNRPL